VADLLKGVASGGWTWVVSWLFPSLIAVAAFGLLILPANRTLPILAELTRLSVAERTATLIGAALMIALLLSALSTILYRLLEGYLLVPEFLRSRLTARQWKKRAAIKQRIAGLQNETEVNNGHGPGKGLEFSLLNEELRRYPVADEQLGPTKLANALRAFETYAYDRYRLDSQLLWNELVSITPESLRKEEAESRASVNFFVSLVFISLSFSVFCVLTLITQGNSWSLTAAAASSTILVPVWYRLAVVSTRAWSSAVQAMVNVGRGELALKLGLRMPASLDEERDMWQFVNWFVAESYDDYWARKLDPFRIHSSNS